MPKISQEEYEELKEALSDGYNWLDRNMYNKLIVHRLRTKKRDHWIQFLWSNPENGYKEIDEKLFQFVKWEEEEPYNIAELVEEYEYKEFYDYVGWKYAERGEAEVKDMKWFKKKLDDIEVNTTSLQNHDAIWMLNRVHELYDQLDEPEVLSQKWIDKHKYRYDNVELVGVKDLQNLLVPKQDVPVIPKFVAEFLIGKEDYMLYELFENEWLYEEHDRVAKWLYDNDELTNKQREINLVMARDRGYTVEEEQKYYVLSKELHPMLCKSAGTDKKIMESTTQLTINEKGLYKEQYALTEQEIKDYDERFWPFRKPVEELEQ